MDSDRQQVSLAQAIKQLRENMPALLEHEALNAQLTRARFLALISQGFNESQALELCRKA